MIGPLKMYRALRTRNVTEGEDAYLLDGWIFW
jgi:hypothetical protein